MADRQSGPGWSDAQWELVGSAVAEAFDHASVAGKFLPCYGPLSASEEYVKDERVSEANGVVSVSDDRTLKLFTLAVRVPLSREQVADETLSSALLAFRRAALLLAQKEDFLVFNGFIENKEKSAPEVTETQPRAASVIVTGPSLLKGLVPAETTATTQRSPAQQRLIRAVNAAIGELEQRAHPGPFACILGNTLFDEAHTPQAASMVMPADRIRPLLRGPLLRCGQMKDDEGILVSLSGTAIDLVVATPPRERVQFLQIKEDAKYLFRVYQKFTLRVKDESAVEKLPIDQRNRAAEGAKQS